MVYCGKPSKACRECRRKRRRCDLQRPRCGQCWRANVECGGWQDDKNEAMFRDQTSATINKAARSVVVRHGGYSGVVKPMKLHPGPARDEFALAYFFDHYWCTPSVISTATASAEGHLSSLLGVCMKAMGLVIGGVAEKSSEMEAEAHRVYHAALTQTNRALISPKAASDDDILLAIMILSTFGAVIEGTRTSSGDLSAHIRGCTALLTARGKSQLRTSAGQRLFIQACVNLTYYCQLTCSYIPAEIHALTEAGKAFVDENSGENIAWRVHAVRLRMTDIYVHILTDQVSDTALCLGALQALIGELESMSTSELLWRTYSNSLSAGRNMDSTDTLYDYMVNAAYDAMYAYQMILHLLIIELLRRNASVLLPIPVSEADARGASSLRAVADLQRTLLTKSSQQIARAVTRTKVHHLAGNSRRAHILEPPAGISHLGVAHGAWSMIESLFPQRQTRLPAGDGTPSVRVARGYGLLWIVVAVGFIAEPASEIRRESIVVLRNAAKQLDIPQAAIFADRLERNEKMSRSSVVLSITEESRQESERSGRIEVLSEEYASAVPP